MNRLVVVFAVIWSLCITLAKAQVAPACSNAVPICNNTPVNGGTNDYGVDDFNGAGKSGCLEKHFPGQSNPMLPEEYKLQIGEQRIYIRATSVQNPPML